MTKWNVSENRLFHHRPSLGSSGPEQPEMRGCSCIAWTYHPIRMRIMEP